MERWGSSFHTCCFERGLNSSAPLPRLGPFPSPGISPLHPSPPAALSHPLCHRCPFCHISCLDDTSPCGRNSWSKPGLPCACRAQAERALWKPAGWCLKALLPKAEHRAWAWGGWGTAVSQRTSGAVSLREVEAEGLCVPESCERHRIGAEEKCEHIHRLNTRLWKAKGKCQHFIHLQVWQPSPGAAENCCPRDVAGSTVLLSRVGGEKPRHNHHVLWRGAEETRTDSCPRGVSG